MCSSSDLTARPGLGRQACASWLARATIVGNCDCAHVSWHENLAAKRKSFLYSSNGVV